MSLPDSAPSTARVEVLVVDDEPASTSLLRITLGRHYVVHTANDGAEALRVLAAHPQVALAIVDQRMPGMSGTEFIQRTVEPYPNLVRVILTGYTDVEALIEAINAGRVYRYLTKPWDKDELLGVVRQGLEVHRLALDNLRLQEELRAANARLRVENTHLRREARGRYAFDEIIGSSPALTRMLALLERVVASEATVLIVGETGTGKELIARAIHYNGPRADKAFVSENCGAIAPDLLTSELFGHRRGAYTGAEEDRLGLFEVADGGTIFLDEIGDCPMDLQTRLLRVLEQGEIRRVGENQPRRIDVRVIAATHHDLEKEAESGTFRKDLYFRLGVVTIRVPPLRERLEDVPPIAHHELERLNATGGKRVAGISSDAMALLRAYAYPGNVRELINEVKRAHTLADDGDIVTPDLLSEKFTGLQPMPAEPSTLRGMMEAYEARCLQEALARNKGNQTRTAVELGISRTGLIEKMQKYKLR